MTDPNTDRQGVTSRVKPATLYRSPTLTTYGSIAKLTLGDNGSIVDQSATMAMMKAPPQG